MEDYEVVPDGPTAFAVKVIYHSGRFELRRGFEIRPDADAWANNERAKAEVAARMRALGQS